MRAKRDTLLVAGDEIARYGFGDGHPFGFDRHDVFLRELKAEELEGRVQLLAPRRASREELESFHDGAYISLVAERSVHGQGYLDAGDTPAVKGVFDAASHVVGASLLATEAITPARWGAIGTVPATSPPSSGRVSSGGPLTHPMVPAPCTSTGVRARSSHRRTDLEAIGCSPPRPVWWANTTQGMCSWGPTRS